MSESESKLQFFITDHAAERALMRLGVAPDVSWWRGLAQRIQARTVRASRYSRKGDREICRYIFPATTSDGAELDLVVVASSKIVDGRASAVWFISLWVDGEVDVDE
jgi:hypothetical protein